MKISRAHIRKIQKLGRRKFHPYLHRAHKKHRLSYRTLYYIKSYGQDRHVWHAIVKQSIKILILASIISTVGGLGLENIQSKLILLMPLIILLPALNDMIGDFGTIVGSKFATMLFLKKVGNKWWKSEEVHKLITTVFMIAFIMSLYIGVLSSIVSVTQGFSLTYVLFFKVLLISIACTLLLIGIICAVAFAGGLYIFRKGEDPNNFLVPITTSVADFGSLVMFSFFVITFI